MTPAACPTLKGDTPPVLSIHSPRSFSMPTCLVCDRRFANRDALVQHLATSSAWHPFCETCNRRFISKDACDGVIYPVHCDPSIRHSCIHRSICWRSIRQSSLAPSVNERSAHLSPSMTTIEVPLRTRTASSADVDSGPLLDLKRYLIRCFLLSFYLQKNFVYI